jgi:hypothetical protein
MGDVRQIQPDPENPDRAYRARQAMLAKLLAQQQGRN